jgi:hypothetical protein
MSSRPHGPTIIEPLWPPPDHSASPTSVGWDERCVLLNYKKGNSSAVLPLPSSACFRARQCRPSCFSLRLVLVNPPIAHLRCCSPPTHQASYFAVFIDNLQKKLGRRPGEEPRPTSLTMPRFVEMFEPLRWTIVVMYLCIVGGACLLLIFHLHIHRPLPHKLR